VRSIGGIERRCVDLLLEMGATTPRNGAIRWSSSLETPEVMARSETTGVRDLGGQAEVQDLSDMSDAGNRNTVSGKAAGKGRAQLRT